MAIQTNVCAIFCVGMTSDKAMANMEVCQVFHRGVSIPTLTIFKKLRCHMKLYVFKPDQPDVDKGKDKGKDGKRPSTASSSGTAKKKAK